MQLSEARDEVNVFYDDGVLRFYEDAGGAMPPTPFSKRQVLCAAVR